MKSFVHRIVICILFGITCAQTFGQGNLYKTIKVLQGLQKVGQSITMTDEDLVSITSETMVAMDASNKVCDAKSKYTIRLKRLTKGMTEVDELQLNFKVYQNQETANAFACPDGSVRIYSKLMDLMNDEELLGIIGHEIGHLAHHHSLKAYKTALLVSAARDGLMATDDYGALAASSLGALTESLINAKYSRMEEIEADDYGYDYLEEMGKNPRAIASALNKLLQLENAPDNKYARYFSTLFSSHPDLRERIQRLEER